MDQNKRLKKLLFVFIIFIFAFSLRLWNLNNMGRTWDESAYVENGYSLVKLVQRGDFKNSFWYKLSDTPPLTRYIYGLASNLDIDNFLPIGQPVFKYDYSFARLVSVIASSLSVVFVFLIGWKYISFSVGAMAAIIFSMLPFFLGLSQLATLESFSMLFFNMTIYSFLNFLNKMSLKNTLVTGILLGFALGTKYTNVILIPLFLWIYIIWYFYKNKKKSKFINKKLILIFFISFFTFFALWPMPWFHLKEVLGDIYEMRLASVEYSIPEVYFGRLVHVPKIYYVVYFLITTPLIVLFLFLIGLKRISDKKTWILYAMIAWFIAPFILSFYNYRQHGVRYIIQIYAPLSLIAALGFDYIIGRFTKKQFVKFLYFISIFIYLLCILSRISPYYLDYFNEVVGGTRGIYEKRMFQLGWWGQGLKEASVYLINNAPKGSKIGIAVSQTSVLPSFPNHNVSNYEEDKRYDYVMVNYYHIIRDKFDDTNIKLRYIPIYNVNADGASLVTLYKLK